MTAEALRWLNGVGDWMAEAGWPAIFQAHPWLYGLAGLGLLAIPASMAAWWVLRRVDRTVQSWRLTLALLPTRAGLRCLRLSRDIRRRCRWLRSAIRREVADRAERQALLGPLERFAARELPSVLDQARVFISLADDRKEGRLRALLDEQTRRWSESPETAGREDQLRSIAETRQRLAKITHANRERDRLVNGLEEVAEALRDLEAEFAGLQSARDQTLPEVREHLEQLARQLAWLRTAHRELRTRR